MLLRNFFKLAAEHIHSAVNVEIASQRDMKPVAFFAFNDKSTIRCAAVVTSLAEITSERYGVQTVHDSMLKFKLRADRAKCHLRPQTTRLVGTFGNCLFSSSVFHT
jgi:hypothetical protein